MVSEAPFFVQLHSTSHINKEKGSMEQKTMIHHHPSDQIPSVKGLKKLLQIALLLAMCIWLLHLQIKNSCILNHGGKGEEMDTGGNFQRGKLKIEQYGANSLVRENLQVKEELIRDETVDQEGEIEISGFQSFHDENGVPPGYLKYRMRGMEFWSHENH